MPIIVNLDVMMAKRHMGAGELAETIGITPANLSILKNNKAKAVRFSTLEPSTKSKNRSCRSSALMMSRSEDNSCSRSPAEYSVAGIAPSVQPSKSSGNAAAVRATSANGISSQANSRGGCGSGPVCAARAASSALRMGDMAALGSRISSVSSSNCMSQSLKAGK